MEAGRKITDIARNLRKADLGGVIFGCTNSTMRECLLNQIFGLPSAHFSYVKNIEPGLPLFLFNYSDKKLHGVFEAATEGKMNINPYGWTANGTGKTQYPAQVRVRIPIQCQPLLEKEYKPIISDNFYSGSHFWFELDHAQASALILLFKSSPVIAGSAYTFPQITPKCTPTKPISSHMDPEFPQKYACSGKNLFELKHDNGASNEDGTYKPSTLNVESPCLDGSDIFLDQRNRNQSEDNINMVVENEKQLIINRLEQLALGSKYQKIQPNTHSEGIHDSHVEVDKNPMEVNYSSQEPYYLPEKYGNICSTDLQFQIDHLRQEFKASSMEQLRRTNALEIKLTESEFQIQQLEGRVAQLETLLSSSATCIDEPSDDMHASSDALVDFCNDLQLGPSNELLFVIGGFDGNTRLSALDCYSLSRDVKKSFKPMKSVRSYAASATLNGEIYTFGGGDGHSWFDTVESYNPSRNVWTYRPKMNEKKGSLAGATVHDKIFAMGGGDGVDSFSSVEMLDPALGRWIRTQSMLRKRFALAAAELNGAIYAVGGYDGKNYLKSAERYDPREISWSQLQSMNSKRGCHSLVVLNEKLYALGGYDGSSMVPSVEMFDPRVGSWMAVDDMKEVRGYSIAAVIGEALYLMGGICNGKPIETVECYKEGQGWEVTNLTGVGRRYFSTAVVLQGPLIDSEMKTD